MEIQVLQDFIFTGISLCAESLCLNKRGHLACVKNSRRLCGTVSFRGRNAYASFGPIIPGNFVGHVYLRSRNDRMGRRAGF